MQGQGHRDGHPCSFDLHTSFASGPAHEQLCTARPLRKYAQDSAEGGGLLQILNPAGSNCQMTHDMEITHLAACHRHCKASPPCLWVQETTKEELIIAKHTPEQQQHEQMSSWVH